MAASVAPPASVTRLSAMRWMPRPNSCAFLAVMVRVLTPIHAISDDRRPYSSFGQRFITTLRPFASARRLVVADAELHPDHFRAGVERERLLDDRDRVLRRTEDVDHVDGLGNVRERGIGLAPEQLLPGEGRIDRDHAVPALEQILEGEITRAAGIGRNADHRDRPHGVEDAADVAVVVTVVVHAGAAFSSAT